VLRHHNECLPVHFTAFLAIEFLLARCAGRTHLLCEPQLIVCARSGRNAR
jgi:hypothetical protein